MMIFLCPYCGDHLEPKLHAGITSCLHCNRVFDDSFTYRVLSASWVCRKWHLDDTLVIQSKCALTQDELEVVRHYVLELGLSHNELLKTLNRLKKKVG